MQVAFGTGTQKVQAFSKEPVMLFQEVSRLISSRVRVIGSHLVMGATMVFLTNLRRKHRRTSLPTSVSGTTLTTTSLIHQRWKRLTPAQVEAEALARLGWGGESYTEQVFMVIEERLFGEDSA